MLSVSRYTIVVRATPFLLFLLCAAPSGWAALSFELFAGVQPPRDVASRRSNTQTRGRRTQPPKRIDVGPPPLPLSTSSTKWRPSSSRRVYHHSRNARQSCAPLCSLPTGSTAATTITIQSFLLLLLLLLFLLYSATRPRELYTRARNPPPPPHFQHERRFN